MTYQVDGQMQYNTSELCDLYADMIDVVEPLFANYGGRRSFGGKIHTVKCFEDNGLVRQMLSEPGVGKVLLIDGGGSSRRALIDGELASLAATNGWEGIVCYGSVRDLDLLEDFDIGIHAVNAIPVGADSKDVGETDLPVNFGGVTATDRRQPGDLADVSPVSSPPERPDDAGPGHCQRHHRQRLCRRITLRA